MDVTKDSPAWMCGLRDGDAIVSVNEWQITLMEKPEVGILCILSFLFNYFTRLPFICSKQVLTWSNSAFSVTSAGMMAADLLGSFEALASDFL